MSARVRPSLATNYQLHEMRLELARVRHENDLLKRKIERRDARIQKLYKALRHKITSARA